MKITDIQEPQQIKTLSYKELESLCADMREFLIDNVSKTGGHLGSSLSVVELITALHYSFDSPKDKIIFDIGHQAYVHKLLTGRANDFPTLRQYKGLSGFLKRSESEHDVWESGHSSTSISAACGFALARKNSKQNHNIISLIGDGSFTSGMPMEAINHLVELRENVIIVINDNEMSISNNVGFIDKMFKNLENHSYYYRLKRKIKRQLKKRKLTQNLTTAISSVKGKIKDEIRSAQAFFTTIGCNYIGVVDGHNIREIISHLEMAKQLEGLTIVHVKTEKGKGYSFAEQYRWHSTPPFNKTTGEPLSTCLKDTYSCIVSKELTNLMKKDEKIFVLTPAMIQGSELLEIQENFPERISDTGMAEEHAITASAAVALGGNKPFVSIYSTFLQRGYDQVFHDIDRHNANVVIGIDRAGLVGKDGETHQGIYDIAFLSHMPNIVIVQGKDDLQTRALLQYAFDYFGPIAVRYPRGGQFSYDPSTKLPKIVEQKWEIINFDKSQTIKDNVVICYGTMVDYVTEILQENQIQDITIINSIFIKPMDKEMLLQLEDKQILIVEEHANTGSLKDMINAFYNQEKISKIIDYANLGDAYVEQGSIQELYDNYGLGKKEILQKIMEMKSGK